jgi:hypothetical protein
MRRFIGGATAQQLLTFLNIDKNIGKIGENKLERCETCTDPGAWYWTDKGMYGYWTHCLVGGHKQGQMPKSAEEKASKRERLKSLRKSAKEMTDDGTPICPEHSMEMVKREGRYGVFWGCSKYPACRITHKHH